jgi:hypothetical protein
VIAAHAANMTVIGGRHYTRFCSAFLVGTPVPPDVRRFEAEFDLPDAETTLEMIR